MKGDKWYWWDLGVYDGWWQCRWWANWIIIEFRRWFWSWRCNCSFKKKNKLRNSHFYRKVLSSAQLFFCPFTTFVNCWRTYVMCYYFSFNWLCTFTVVGYFTYSWLVVTYKSNIIMRSYHKNRNLGKLPFFQICLNFPQKISSFIWKIFSCPMITS